MARLAVALVLALAATIVSGMVPPLISQQGGVVERGFPLPWLFQSIYVGSGLPIIGWLFQTAESLTTTYSVQNFVLDFAVFTVAFYLLVHVFSKGSNVQRRRAR